ncbi:glycosyltransferase family 4 protein [Flaviaesturariibacter amylovorans]|uniref:Glycosyltransferase family 4 protein n=1 Tax=Flaviaesturariibacter amylovorans TaxID=1084520 RepID=A0ABP8HJX2_9BACT
MNEFPSGASAPRRKIGIIVQRYGVQVNGGAEVHARMVAEQLAQRYDVTVLTSRALDYSDWKPYYAEGPSEENGIRVLRFNNKMREPRKVQGYYGRKARGRHLVQKLHRALGAPGWFTKLFPNAAITDEDGMRWLEAQGPAMPDLLTYLKEKEQEYTAFIAFTALYYPGALSVLTVPQKSIFIPTMHDEKAAYIHFYRKVMAAPAWILFNTRAEQVFSQKLFPIAQVQQRIVGVGIDLLRDRLQPDASVLGALNIKRPYLVYVGRIDSAKGCDVMIEYFLRFLKETGAGLELVLVGKEMMPVPEHPAIIRTGFIPDERKDQLMLQAGALIIPSLYESLSLVLLESFGCGVPVLANGRTEVLHDHIEASKGGWTFTDYDTFKAALEDVVAQRDTKEKGEAGYRYVRDRYSWSTILGYFDEAISDIEARNR